MREPNPVMNFPGIDNESPKIHREVSKDISQENELPKEQKRKKKKKSGGFQSMNLSEPVFRGVIKMGYKIPTPIQRKAIPPLLMNRDVMAMARTGSGKTAAFLIPMFQRLGRRGNVVRAMILSPTRELAMQTSKFCFKLGRFTGLRFCLLVGGFSMTEQFSQLAENPDVIIATPGRLLHHLTEVKFSLRKVEYFVVDEADRMFEAGFANEINELLRQLPTKRQTALFSATLPKAVAEFSKAGLSDPVIVRLDIETKISPHLRLLFITSRADLKESILLYLLMEVIPKEEQTLVFAPTRFHVEYLQEMLQLNGLSTTYIHGQMDSHCRTANTTNFRHKKTKILVVTDVAARGIDIPLLDNVINFQFPDKVKLFVHRVGRVARAGRKGIAFSLVTAADLPYMIDLHVFLGYPLQNGLGSDKKFSPREVYFGKIYHSKLDDYDAKIKTLLNDQDDLKRLYDSSKRAFCRYNATRSGASHASAKKAKEFSPVQSLNLHPDPCLQKDLEINIATEKFRTAIQSLKPSHTIFEAGNKEDIVMQRKRKKHDRIIKGLPILQLSDESFCSLHTEKDKKHIMVNRKIDASIASSNSTTDIQTSELRSEKNKKQEKEKRKKKKKDGTNSEKKKKNKEKTKEKNKEKKKFSR